MANFIERAASNLSALSPAKKGLLALVFAGGLGTLAVVWLWVQQPDFKVLFSNLSADDAGLVVSKFQEMNVPYEFSSDGGAILVPAERVHELRIMLATEGLPQGGGVGFEIFDESSFGTTEFAQKLNYRRALQGELSRTITQIDEIANARVHLVIPEPSLFTEQQELTRASVVVSLKAGHTLSDAQVQGITHLVAGSVEGLSAESVTIVDNRGNIRSSGTGASATAQMSNTQLDYQKTLELKIQDTIESMLSQVVGRGKALVRVSATLDLRQVELTEERFDPETQVVRSEQRSQGNASGISQKVGPSGVPGVSSNLPGADNNTGSRGTNNQNNSTNSSEVINYEISKIVSRVIEPFGTIKRLSVAALIDGTYETLTAEDGSTSQKYVPRGEDEMSTLEAIVKKAMGFSIARQDQLEVVNVPFNGNETIDTMPPEKSLVEIMTAWMPLVRQIVGPLLVLFILSVIIRPVIKTLTAAPPQPIALPEAGAGAGVMATIEPEVEALDPGPTRDDVLAITKENPNVATHVVKKWIKESKGA